MTVEPIRIQLSGLAGRDREQATGELAQILKRHEPRATIEREPDNPLAQDAGSTLILILGSGAVIQLAKGIQNWMARWGKSELILSQGTRKIHLKNVSSGDALKAAELFLRESQPQ